MSDNELVKELEDCEYCTGCDTNDSCVDLLWYLHAAGVFFVDGIRYDPQTNDVCRNPIIGIRRDFYGCPDGDCGCTGTVIRLSDPPSPAELDQWIKDSTTFP